MKRLFNWIATELTLLTMTIYPSSRAKRGDPEKQLSPFSLSIHTSFKALLFLGILCTNSTSATVATETDSSPSKKYLNPDDVREFRESAKVIPPETRARFGGNTARAVEKDPKLAMQDQYTSEKILKDSRSRPRRSLGAADSILVFVRQTMANISDEEFSSLSPDQKIRKLETARGQLEKAHLKAKEGHLLNDPSLAVIEGEIEKIDQTLEGLKKRERVRK